MTADNNSRVSPDREALGRVVREAWIKWAQQQSDPKPSWLVPWEGLSEPDKEVDRQIAEAVVAAFISRGDSVGMPVREAAAMLRRLSSLSPAVGEWQPIASAPKDGSEFLVFLPDDGGGDQMVVFYDQPSASAPSYCWHRSDGLAYHQDLPTHWCPLPPAPPQETKP